MNSGKATCDKLKAIRRAIAEANNIDYTPTECTFEGGCNGTCPFCDAEIEELNKLLAQKTAEEGHFVIPSWNIDEDNFKQHFYQTDRSQVEDFEGDLPYNELEEHSTKRPRIGINAFEDKEEQEKRRQQWVKRNNPIRKLKITKSKDTGRYLTEDEDPVEEGRLMGRISEYTTWNLPLIDIKKKPSVRKEHQDENRTPDDNPDNPDAAEIKD